MIDGNLSPVFRYPPEIHGVVCEFLDEVSLTRMGFLSREWDKFIKEDVDPAWRNLYEKIWAEPLITTSFLSNAYRAFHMRYKCVKLHLLYQNSLNTLPHVVHQIEKVRKITSHDYFNALLIERHRETVLSRSSLFRFSQIPFPANLNALPLEEDDKRRWNTAFNFYDQYSNIPLQLDTAKFLFEKHLGQSTPIYQSSIFREAARYIIREISRLHDPKRLINPDESVVDSCLSHAHLKSYLMSEFHLIMWKSFSPTLFEEKSEELLFEAAHHGALEIIGALLQERDCSVKEKEGEDEKNWTALHYLSLHPDREIAPQKVPLWKQIANKLMEMGCSPLQRGDKKDSPITLAMRAGNAYLMDCFFRHLQKQKVSRESEEWKLLVEASEGDKRKLLLEDLSPSITISEEDKLKLASMGWAQLIEVLKENEEELLLDSQIEMIGMALKLGFCASIRENKNFIYKLLDRSEWDILPLFFNYCSSAQMEEMLSLVFEWASVDCACDDQDDQSDTYTNLLPNLENFLEASRSHKLDFSKTIDSQGNTCLHSCITFFEGEIQSVKDSLYDDEYEEDEGEEILEMLQQSYLSCVKILLTNQNFLQTNSHSDNDPLDMVSDREGDVYGILLESMNPSKKRASRD